jgi:bacteriocin-like protein
MSNPIESTTAEPLTEEDLAQVNGGMSIKELAARMAALGPFLPFNYVPVGPIVAVHVANPGPEYHPPEGANDPRTFNFLGE